MAAVLSDGAEHTDAHLVRATEELQAFLMLGTDLPVQVTRLIHQLVSLEGRRLIMRLDMRFTVVSQAHEARLDGLVATANTKIAEGFAMHVGERSEFWELAPWLVVYIRQITSQHRTWRESCAALWTVVHTHVVILVPVDLDALLAVGVTTGDGDWVSDGVHAQWTVSIWW